MNHIAIYCGSRILCALLALAVKNADWIILKFDQLPPKNPKEWQLAEKGNKLFGASRQPDVLLDGFWEPRLGEGKFYEALGLRGGEVD